MKLRAMFSVLSKVSGQERKRICLNGSSAEEIKTMASNYERWHHCTLGLVETNGIYKPNSQNELELVGTHLAPAFDFFENIYGELAA